jgi:hypothetical protein
MDGRWKVPAKSFVYPVVGGEKGKYRPCISVAVLSAGICTRHLICMSKIHLEHSLSHAILQLSIAPFEQARRPVFQPAGGLVIASCRLHGSLLPAQYVR